METKVKFVFSLNFLGTFLPTKVFARGMAERKAGSIINISSIAGHEPNSQFVAYGVAKSSLSFLTRELAQEFAPKIRVNAIGVGSTKTGYERHS